MIKIAYILEFSLIHGRGLISFQHIKNEKSIINNYRPVSLLPICGKIFERKILIYNPVFLYLENNELLTPHQSGFRPNDSYMYQLISMVHHIYANFIITHHLTLEVIFLVSQKRLIKYGTNDCYTNLNLLVYQETFSIYFVVSLMIDIKEKFSMVYFQIGHLS